ncbi:TonB-dependent siderophore receptor [Variovorax sp. KBW07]|uniref:TonB-dependent receptor n=1 Tax=Variovorax sp. KBW07 TaxID=2153358 RepID=UPI000F5760CB|nr:TonB-dependent siderophore receptor [Variovorax sp. KBW07]RQO55832.1 TonB-dependent siderophore receptor [Variovorax sp. KBW07]
MGQASPARDRTGAPLQWARLSGLSLGLGLELVFGHTTAFAQSAETAGNRSLAPVQVEAARHTPLAIDEPTQTGSRLGLTPLETPASIEVLSGDTIRARGDVSVIEAATRATGITGSPAPGNGGTSMAARGFSGHGSVMQLYDGTRLYAGAGTVTFPFDTWSIDRIEVLRGAASVMYGEGAIGGAINVVPKKPSRGPIANEALVTIGSDATRQVAFGSGGAINDMLSYRFDISHRKTDGFMLRGEAESLAVGAAVRLDVSPQLQFTLSHDEGRQSPQRYQGVPLIDGRLTSQTLRQNYNVDDAELKYNDKWTRLDAQWTPNSAITVRNQLYRLESKRHWRNSETYTFNATTRRVTRGDYLEIGHDQEQIGNRTDATFRHSMFGMANQVLVGFDVNRIDFLGLSDSPYGGRSVIDPFVFQPGYYASPVAYLPRYKTKTSTYAFFAEDKLAFNEQWSVVGSLRWDHAKVARVDQQNFANRLDKTFEYATGRLGVVYAPDASQSFYAQVARAADPLTSLISTSATQAPFELSTGKQVEVGYKRQLPEGRGAWTVAAYRIEKSKLLSRDAKDPTVTQQIGKQSSEGIEATLDLALSSTLRLEANVAKLRARYDDFNEVVGKSVVSRAGNTPSGVPEEAANLWLHWRFLPQWEAEFGVRYVGSRQVDTANTRKIGSYTVADAGVSWQVNPSLKLALRGYNLADRKYPVSFSNGGNQWILGRPRSFELSALVNF